MHFKKIGIIIIGFSSLGSAQTNTADNTRLGIPGFFMADGPHGVRDGLATSFPVGISMAATWDRDLIYHLITNTKDAKTPSVHYG